MEYYSTIKKSEIMSFSATYMDYGPRDYHIEWSQPDREWLISYEITYMWKLKKWYIWTQNLQNRNRFTDKS